MCEVVVDFVGFIGFVELMSFVCCDEVEVCVVIWCVGWWEVWYGLF